MGIFLVPRKRRSRSYSAGRRSNEDECPEYPEVAPPNLNTQEWQELMKIEGKFEGLIPIPDAVGIQCLSDFLGWTELVAIQTVSRQLRDWSTAAIRETSHLVVKDMQIEIADCNLRRFLLSTSPNLTQVTLSKCHKFTDAFLMALGECCPEIKHIYVADCPMLTSDGFQAILDKCHSLISIQVEGCSEAFGDEVVFKINDNHRNLKTVKVNQSTSLTRNGVAFLGLKTRSSLCSVNLLGCPKVDDRAMEALTRICTNLKSITIGDVNKITNQTLYSIARFLGRTLQSFHLESSRGVTDSGLRAMAGACTQLRKLSLVRCMEIRDDGVCALVSANPQLVLVSLSGSQRVGDMSVAAIASKVVALEHIDVQSLALQNLSVSKLATAFGKTLTHACFRSVGTIDDRGLVPLASKCTKLRHLDLHCCTALSNRTAEAIARNCTGLEFLDISWCYRVEAEQFLAIVQNNQKLRVLRAYGCDEVAYLAQSYVLKARACQRDVIQLTEPQAQQQDPQDAPPKEPLERRPSKGGRARSKSLFSNSGFPMVLGSTASRHQFPASRPPLKGIETYDFDDPNVDTLRAGRALLSPTLLSRKTFGEDENMPHIRMVPSNQEQEAGARPVDMADLPLPVLRRHTSSPNVFHRHSRLRVPSVDLRCESPQGSSPETVQYRRIFGTSEKDLKRVRAFSQVETSIST